MPRPPERWVLPDRGPVGMICLIIAEAAIFLIFVVAYLYYLGKNLRRARSRATCSSCRSSSASACCASSATIGLAVRALRRGRGAAFTALWLANTIVLALDLSRAAPASNGSQLIYEKG